MATEQELRERVRALIVSCENHAQMLAHMSWSGNFAEYSGRGKAVVFCEAAKYLREHLRNSKDLAAALNDLFDCMMQSQEDEQAEANTIHIAFSRRKKRRRREYSQVRYPAYLRALGRAHAYREVGAQVKGLIERSVDPFPLQALSQKHLNKECCCIAWASTAHVKETFVLSMLKPYPPGHCAWFV